ncbi:hypothetical protein [Cardinium endosymbiont of Sogatella furcifera]|uniref:hypothetical protein n=1 Tax=Cardinium endosymbiont of Sogatella furcifera TaxID=650378 RepID=UPI0013B3CD45|nr:hypothetical protein [Cardinium endosymbiont of Sogatella furcifera]
MVQEEFSKDHILTNAASSCPVQHPTNEGELEGKILGKDIEQDFISFKKKCVKLIV